MEIALLSEASIKIRSKLASFIVDPTVAIGKTEADAVMCLEDDKVDTSQISEFRVVISGPGEYEVKGVKISSVKSGEGIVYKLSVDRMEVALAKASTLSKIESATPAHVVIINADEIPSDKTITAMQPSVVVLYGEKAVEAAKNLKEQAAAPVSKFAVTFEKLPQEMEVIVLG